MSAIEKIEESYEIIDKIDLKSNKKQALIVNCLSLVLMVGLAVIGHFMVSIDYLFNQNILIIPLIIACYVLYIVLHEAVHGIVMKLLKAKKVKFGFNFIYAYAGTDAYFKKKDYICIALAPVITFLILFTPALVLLSKNWFWVVYIIQVVNIGGSAGDIFVSLYLIKYKNVYIQDSGYAMNIYGIKKEL